MIPLVVQAFFFCLISVKLREISSLLLLEFYLQHTNHTPDTGCVYGFISCEDGAKSTTKIKTSKDEKCMDLFLSTTGRTVII